MFQKIVQWVKNNPHYIVLFLSIAIIYRKWIFSQSILTYGDWVFQTPDALSTIRFNYFVSWWPDALGKVNLSIGQGVTWFLYGLLHKLFGLDFGVLERIIHLLPIIIITPTSAILLARKYFSSKLAVLASTIVYSFNTYFLILQTGHLTLMASFAFLPAIINFFDNYIKHGKSRDLFLTSILFFAASSYETRAGYVTLLILGIYTTTTAITGSFGQAKINLMKLLFRSGLVVGFYIGLSLFWLLPQMFGGSLTENELFTRGLFGNDFWRLENALTIYHPFWSFEKPSTFNPQPIPQYFWILPALVGLSIFINRRQKHLVFYVVTILVGIMLVKQSDTPFPNLYQWLFDNVPGFNAFREATKFYPLIILGYSIIIGHLIENINFSKIYLKNQVMITKTVIFGIILLLFLPNVIPYANSKIQSLTVDRQIPTDYQKFNNFLDKGGSDDFYRTLWVPYFSRFADYGTYRPRLSLGNLVLNDQSQLFSETVKLNTSAANKVKQSVNDLNFDNLLNQFNIKYIIVPPRDQANDDDFFVHYGNDRNYYINSLDSKSYLKKLDLQTSELIVYENTGYNPYVVAFTDLNKIQSIDKQPELTKFYGSNKQSFFTTDPKVESAAKLYDIYDEISSKSAQSDKFELSGEMPKDTYVQTLSSNSQIYYSIINSEIVFALKSYEVNDRSDEFIISDSDITILAKYPYNASYRYFTNFDQGDYQELSDSLQPNSDNCRFDTTVKSEIDISRLSCFRLLGSNGQSSTFNLYTSTKGENLVSNSFEKNLFSTVPEDCNPYDNSPLFEMTTETDDTKPDFVKVLQFNVTRHTACSGPKNIKVEENKDYYIGFDYFFEFTRATGVEFRFNDQQRTVINYDIIKDSGAWRRYSNFVTAPEGATEVDILLKGLPDDLRRKTAITKFDNFQFGKAEIIPIQYSELLSQTNNQDKKILNNYRIEYRGNDFTGQNLIKNGGFEEGLWQDRVGDCNAFDDNPKIEMNHVREGNNSEYALQLSATRHTACTAPQGGLPVSESGKYLLSFDYRSSSAESAGYYIGFDDPQKTSISERIPITNSDWHTYQNIVSIPYGAKNAYLVVYSYSEDSLASKNINLYDNFSFTKVPELREMFYIVGAPTISSKQPKSVDYSMISPTITQVTVKSAQKSFYLASSSTYNKAWSLQSNNSKGDRSWLWNPFADVPNIKDKNHFNLNGWQNGWLVNVDEVCGRDNLACKSNGDGTYDIEMLLSFNSQRWLNFGLILSLKVFVMLIVVCVVIRKYSRKSDTHQSLITGSLYNFDNHSKKVFRRGKRHQK